jgi:rhodanese-related sulfurtransferase
MNIATITPTELYRLMTEGQKPEILDVRTKAEYEKVRIPGTTLIPLDQLDVREYLARRSAPKDQPIYVLCKGGTRARMACERFIEAGFDNVVLIEGGILQWEACGLPVQREAPNIEAQVRITIGAMNLLGVILGVTVSPYFLLISGFVSCGMIYASLTGKCPLASVLAAMPWNRVTSATACCASGR